MSLSITQVTEDGLTTMFQTIARTHNHNSDLRTRFLLIDKYIARESEVSAERRQARVRARQGQKKFIGNTEVPLIYTKVDTALSYFGDKFLTGHPIFSAVTPRDLQDISSMMHAMMIRDQARYKWVSNFLMTFRDGLKYNLHAVETLWNQRYITRPTEGKSGEESSQQVIEFEGQNFQRLNPYNLIFDTSVYPDSVSTDGIFSGYVRRMNFVQAKAFVNALNNEFKLLRNLKNAFTEETKGALATTLYYEPKILEHNAISQTDTNWSSFFGFSEKSNRINATGFYEVVPLYLRIIPKDFGIIAPRSGSPSVWKAIFMNSQLIYLQQLPRDTFPIKMQLLMDEGNGFESKSFAENLIELQDDASSLKNARMASLRRAISDRALYDPLRVRESDVNSANPESKIPVKMNQYNKDLASAYYQIPYRDDLAQSYNAEFAQLLSFTDEVSGLNQATQGQFVKGNKTLFEFQETMSNARGRMDLQHLQLGSNFLHDCKEDMKQNYLRFAVQEELFDRKQNNIVEVDPQRLREQEAKIQIADGQTPASKLISAEMLQLALQTMPIIPGLNQQYDTAQMFVYLLKNQGLEDLDDFKREEPLAQPELSSTQAGGQQGAQRQQAGPTGVVG